MAFIIKEAMKWVFTKYFLVYIQLPRIMNTNIKIVIITIVLAFNK